jgi:hypothetical protein
LLKRQKNYLFFYFVYTNELTLGHNKNKGFKSGCLLVVDKINKPCSRSLNNIGKSFKGLLTKHLSGLAPHLPY